MRAVIVFYESRVAIFVYVCIYVTECQQKVISVQSQTILLVAFSSCSSTFKKLEYYFIYSLIDIYFSNQKEKL